MPDIFTIISRWWKAMLIFTLIATIIAAIITFLQPKEYAATVTALPSSIVNTDKARIFNSNIQSLYSDLGSADDLDRIIGTANLDTIYMAVAKQKNLAQHYQLEKPSVIAAATSLKKNAKISKSEYGQLKIKVWDRDANMAAALATALFEQLQQIHQTLQGQSNALVLQKIREDYSALQQQYTSLSDSLKRTSGAIADVLNVRKTAQLEQLQQYEKLAAEYSLMVKTNPPVLMVVEAAQASATPDKPKTTETIAVVFFAALAFSFLLALFLENKKNAAPTGI
jgi:uncharacterized protein involved in exopolysaccharide biosynthesis